MNAPTNIAPLANLSAAENTLVRQLHAAADRLDAVGTADLDAALARLRQSAEHASARLVAAAREVNAIAAEVLNYLDDVAAGIGEDLLTDRGIFPPESLESTEARAPLPEMPTDSTPSIPTTVTPNAETTPEPSGQNEANATSHSTLDDTSDRVDDLPTPRSSPLPPARPWMTTR
jgi:hypothetical protein